MMFPASMAVAPNSPKPRANASTPPLIIPGKALGINTFKKMFHSLIPKVLAAYTKSVSTCSKAPLEFRYMSGNEMTTAAITVALKLNAMRTPNTFIKNLPMG